MITDRYTEMISEMGMRSMVGSNDYSEELAMLLRERAAQRELTDRERELSRLRSGSAPPTVEASLNAALFGGVGSVSEEELRSDPAYVSYYYQNVNMNPRLPPPLLSKEDWRLAQRVQSGIGGGVAVGNGRRLSRNGGGVESLFSMQPDFGVQKGEDQMQAKQQNEHGGGGLFGLSELGSGNRQKSMADMVQHGMSNGASNSRQKSLGINREFEGVESSESNTDLQHELASSDATHYVGNMKGISSPESMGSSAHQTYASALGASLSRSGTPDPQAVARAPSPRIPPVGAGRVSSLEQRSTSFRKSFDNVSPDIGESSDLISALSGMKLSGSSMMDEGKHPAPQIRQEVDAHQNLFHLQSNQNPSKHPYNNSESTVYHRLSTQLPNSYIKGPPSPLNTGGGSPSQYLNVDSPHSLTSNYGLGAPGIDSRAMGGLTPGPNLLAAAAELRNVGGVGSGNALHMASMDPSYLQHLRSPEYAAAPLNDLAISQESLGPSYMELLGLQKAYFEALLQKSQYGHAFGKSGNLNQFYGNLPRGIGMPYPGSPMGSPVFPNSPIGSGSPVRLGERHMRFAPGFRNSFVESWPSEHSLQETFPSSLLDEFKSNKTKCFELAEISDHVVEFSADQYGSRFIQQKLETASSQEKNMVFYEIMPHALSLMTDVFGNYVIQKFFEHGSASQIRQLADKLTGHVLTLSLQMYGCRVIQKAIEVIELDQQTKLVAELDGHIMRCVRDQNGNHVIQKCIECVPEAAIQFIITTFYDQVVTLSTHPYGCRVIQRVLEHCSDTKTQTIVMDEIMQSVCMLAQDQYGNYVIQHVLEHGKPHERTAIINQLIGKIVQMSQQKFASNVVEKCLTFGTPEERQTLVDEMLGSTEENEPLQVMMKDQFANYVVQKVLETCDDQQLEMILNRIKVHLNALKKYTYGKHIVARVEKLVAAGERRISILSACSA